MNCIAIGRLVVESWIVLQYTHCIVTRRCIAVGWKCIAIGKKLYCNLGEQYDKQYDEQYDEHYDE